MKLFDATLGTLEHALDARLLRHNVLASNLANADTPGFVARDIDFAAAMRESAPARQGTPQLESSPRGEGAPLEPTRQLDLASAGHAIAGAPSSPDIPLAAAGAPTLGAPGSILVDEQGAKAGLDGNAVDVDRALAAVSENAIQYNAAARVAQKKLAILRYVASDGTV